MGGTNKQTENAKFEAILSLRFAESGTKKKNKRTNEGRQNNKDKRFKTLEQGQKNKNKDQKTMTNRTNRPKVPVQKDKITRTSLSSQNSALTCVVGG